jgi:hypothetical protein
MIGRIGILAILAMGLVCVACGSDDDDGAGGGQQQSGSKCEQACQKLETCSPGTVCQINGACSGQNEDLADCILSKECNETNSCFLIP